MTNKGLWISDEGRRLRKNRKVWILDEHDGPYAGIKHKLSKDYRKFVST